MNLPPLLRSPRFFVPAILAAALVLRLILAIQGGQYYFGDEERYDRGVVLYRALTTGDFAQVRTIAALPEHALFPWLTVVVTAGQHLLAQFTPYGDWSAPQNIALTMWIGAALLSLFSTLNLFLLHRLARVAGAGETAAVWALLLMAASNTAFYHARHLLPYECAISAALAALITGLRAPTSTRALVCGLLGGGVYGLYNGYWFLVPLLWLVHTLAHWRSPRRWPVVLWNTVGFLIALGLPVLIGSTLGGQQYWAALGTFSRSATLGMFAEAWSLPWAYLWHSEGVLGVAVVAVIALAIGEGIRKQMLPAAWVRLTMLALVTAYGLLLLFAHGLELFVVYARTVKPLIPMFCLLGGWALSGLLANRPGLRPVVAAGIVVAATFNLLPHFGRVFPRDVETAVLQHWGNPKHTLTIAGSLYVPYGAPVNRPDLALVNAQLLYPVRALLPLPRGETLLRVTHPLAYKPFQYECHTPRERSLIRQHDLSIRLIRLADPAALPDNPPLSMLYQPADYPTGR